MGIDTGERIFACASQAGVRVRGCNGVARGLQEGEGLCPGMWDQGLLNSVRLFYEAKSADVLRGMKK